MKKSILVLIAMIAIGMSANAQTKTSHYTFSYSENSDDRIVYVSDIIEGQVDTQYTLKAVEVTIQWETFFKAEIGDKQYKFDKKSWLWEKNKKDAVKRRLEMIGDWKESGYTVKYLHGFTYFDD